VIVLDASAAIEFLLNTALGGRVGQCVATLGREFHVPHLLDVEVLQVVRRLCLVNTVSVSRAQLLLRDLADLPLIRHSHEHLLGRAWELRASLTAYDAVYVALAEALPASLVTCDARLGRAPGHRATIEVVR
jgi:predicted nucleic acid-binding protein